MAVAKGSTTVAGVGQTNGSAGGQQHTQQQCQLEMFGECVIHNYSPWVYLMTDIINDFNDGVTAMKQNWNAKIWT